MCVGCLSTRSGWFKHSEPKRTYTNHTSTELVRCVGCFCTSSGWYKHIEPHLTYTNHTSTELARCVGCLNTSSGWVKHSEPTRTTPSQSSRCGWLVFPTTVLLVMPSSDSMDLILAFVASLSDSLELILSCTELLPAFVASKSAQRSIF